ncbi:hypothetical protein NKI59_28140 [Mesorhizobium sp. M0598]
MDAGIIPFAFILRLSVITVSAFIHTLSTALGGKSLLGVAATNVTINATA